VGADADLGARGDRGVGIVVDGGSRFSGVAGVRKATVTLIRPDSLAEEHGVPATPAVAD
jgi:hypothetical protein